MKKIIIISLLLVSTILIAGDKEILQAQANRMLRNRQYEKIDKLYSDWLQDYPQDLEIVGKLIENKLVISKIPDAESLFDQYQARFPAEGKVKFFVLINLKKGEHKLAYREAEQFLEDVDDLAKYLEISRVFESNRQHEFAANILLLARKKSGQDDLYARELANLYFNQAEYKEAIAEFFVMLDKESRYHYFASSKIKEILKIDPKFIDEVKKHAERTTNDKAREILANAYSEIDRYSEAIEQYRYLPIKSLQSFGRKLESAKKYVAAKLVYEDYLERSSDALANADIFVEIAKIEIKQNNLGRAKQLLNQVYHDEKISSSRFARRTNANRLARELLGEIALRENQDVKVVIKYLAEAEKFCFNARSKEQNRLKITELRLMNGEFEIATKEIQRAYQANQKTPENRFNIVYLDYLSNLMRNETAVDSLLGELMIGGSSNYLTNDALLLKIYSDQLSEIDRELFLQAFRFRTLYNVKGAVTKLEEIYHNSKNEKMLILAAEWSGELSDSAMMERYLRNDFKDKDLQDYATLRLTELLIDNEMAANFLLENSQSIFSGRVRNILKD